MIFSNKEYIRQRHAQRAVEKAKADAIAKEIVNKDISAFNDTSGPAQIKTQTVDTKNQYKNKLRKLLIHQLNHKEMII